MTARDAFTDTHFGEHHGKCLEFAERGDEKRQGQYQCASPDQGFSPVDIADPVGQKFVAQIDGEIGAAQEYGDDDSDVDSDLDQYTLDHVPDNGIGTLRVKIVEPFSIQFDDASQRTRRHFRQISGKRVGSTDKVGGCQGRDGGNGDCDRIQEIAGNFVGHAQ